jgi:XTP/dITP diphosphohydrolase
MKQGNSSTASASDLLFATTNRGKQREILGLLAGLPIRLLFPQDLGDPEEVEETGSTFAENAELKARGYARLLPGGYVAAEDSGIVVPALGGEPGVYSARYGGLKDDKARNALLLERMRDLSGEDRAAYYEAVVVCLCPDGKALSFSGRVDGVIAPEPSGPGGFGYDPIFFHADLGCTFGETTQEQKDRLSHRGEAVRALRAFLAQRLQGQL